VAAKTSNEQAALKNKIWLRADFISGNDNRFWKTSSTAGLSKTTVLLKPDFTFAIVSQYKIHVARHIIVLAGSLDRN
jgi:hypothetical protein